MSLGLSSRLGSLSSSKEGHKDDNESRVEQKDTQGKAGGGSNNMNLNRCSSVLQRCVILQRDEKGYGLTVTGGSPVYVQEVKDNGAAKKADVRVGDTIIKVNGTLVTNCDHKEVVNLIKSGSYVALTLMGKSNQRGSSTPPSALTAQVSQVNTSPISSSLPPSTLSTQYGHNIEQITGPQPVDAQKSEEYTSQRISVIRTMYEQAHNEFYFAKRDYNNSPTPALQATLMERQATLKKLDQQLCELTGIPTESQLSPSVRSATSPPPKQTDSYTGYIDLESGPECPSRQSAYIPYSTNQPPTQTSHAAPKPTPWLSGGFPIHKKSGSMPETLVNFNATQHHPPQKDVNLSRSHSDSKRPPQIFAVEMQSDENVNRIPSSCDSEKTLSLQDIGGGDNELSNSDHMILGSPQHSPNPAKHQFNSYCNSQYDDIGSDTELGTNEDYLHIQQHPHNNSILSMEDEELADNDSLPFGTERALSSQPCSPSIEYSEDSPFADLMQLKMKNAHLAVFLSYLISNEDPSPMLFYLVVDSYVQNTSKSDLRKWAYEIYSTFLMVDEKFRPPLYVEMDASTLHNIENTIYQKYDKEDLLKHVFQTARHTIQHSISNKLAAFRHQMVLGLGGFYGTTELTENMDRQSEIKLIEKCLGEHLVNYLDEEDDKSQALASALFTVMKSMGVTPGSKSAPVSLERCQSFVSKDKKAFKFKNSKKNHVVRGHQFNPHQFYQATYCGHCHKMLWGVNSLGAQCCSCQVNVHKSCVDEITEHCQGKKKKRQTGSGLLNRITRKTSTNSATANRDSQLRWREEGSQNPLYTTTSTYSSLGLPDMNDPTQDGRNTVSNLIQQIETGGPLEISDDLRSPTSPNANSDAASVLLQNGDEQKRKNSNLNRSESLNKKKNERQKDTRRTRSDVQAEEVKTVLSQSQASSTSSISGKSHGSMDSPSTSATEIGTIGVLSQISPENDSDFEVETELPSLDSYIPKSEMKNLKKADKKRQEVINELFHTERNHVRNLKVMKWLFYNPLKKAKFSEEFVKLLFPNIDKMLKIHGRLNNAMREKRKESVVIGNIADIFLDNFSGESGITFQETCAECCQNQSHALEMLKRHQRKDSKLSNLLQEAHANRYCRRLELKDLLPTLIQRITKYPLFIEKLIHYSTAGSEEAQKLSRSLECSRRILNYVNNAVSECENMQKLTYYQMHLDKKSIESSTYSHVNIYKDIDLRDHKMLYEGMLQLRIAKGKPIEVQTLLLEDMLVFLQKQADDRYVLKCQYASLSQNVKDNPLQSVYSPFLSLETLIHRDVATDKRSIFLLTFTTCGEQKSGHMYQITAHSAEEKKRWLNKIKIAADAYKEKTKTAEKKTNVSDPSAIPKQPTNNEGTGDKHKYRTLSVDSGKTVSNNTEENQDSNLNLGHNTERAEVFQPLTTATPLESLKVKDDLIVQALEEKQALVGQVLGVPAEHVEHIAEMASIFDDEKDVKELLLSSIYESTRLSGLVNSSLNIHSKPTTTNESPSIQTMDPALSSSTLTDTDQSPTKTLLLYSLNSRVSRSISEPEKIFQTGLSVPPQTSDSVSTNPGCLEAVSKDTLTSLPGDQPSLPPSFSGATNSHIDPSIGISDNRKDHHPEVHVSLSSATLLDISSKLSSHLRELLSMIKTQEEEREKLKQQLSNAEKQLEALSSISSFPRSLGVPQNTSKSSSSSSSSSSNSTVTSDGTTINRLVVSYSSSTQVIKKTGYKLDGSNTDLLEVADNGRPLSLLSNASDTSGIGVEDYEGEYEPVQQQTIEPTENQEERCIPVTSPVSDPSPMPEVLAVPENMSVSEALSASENLPSLEEDFIDRTEEDKPTEEEEVTDEVSEKCPESSSDTSAEDDASETQELPSDEQQVSDSEGRVAQEVSEQEEDEGELDDEQICDEQVPAIDGIRSSSDPEDDEDIYEDANESKDDLNPEL